MRLSKILVALFGSLIVTIFIWSFQARDVASQEPPRILEVKIEIEGWGGNFNRDDAIYRTAYLFVKVGDQVIGSGQIAANGFAYDPPESRGIRLYLSQLREINRIALEFNIAESKESPKYVFRSATPYPINLSQIPGRVIILTVFFRNPDHDGDGLPSLDEAFLIWRTATCGLPALVQTDPFRGDTDGDGLDDKVELTGKNRRNVVTDPSWKDSDFDELDDGQELNILGTNPCDPDGDVDGLRDGLEHKTGTNVFKADTDGDGLCDGPRDVSGVCVAGEDMNSKPE